MRSMLRLVTGKVDMQVAKQKSEAGGEREATIDDEKCSVLDVSDTGWLVTRSGSKNRSLFPYTRPEFLFLCSEDELHVSADQKARPVIVPKDPVKMPMFAGYAETVNAGKTTLNEDQAVAKVLTLVKNMNSFEHDVAENRATKETPRASDYQRLTPKTDEQLLPAPHVSLNGDNNGFRLDAVYFAVFDGHFGTGASLMCANCLHEHVRNRLSQVLDVVEKFSSPKTSNADVHQVKHGDNHESLNLDGVVIGALENAFIDMDNQIEEEKLLLPITGGCTAIVALFLAGRLYVAAAGNCRALLCSEKGTRQLNTVFSPLNERRRLQSVAYRHPSLLRKQFSRLFYSRPLTDADLKSKVFYQDWYMDGWAVKTVQPSDLLPSMIAFYNQKYRLLNTTSVTRGFGDHHLVAAKSGISVKSFLSPLPEVVVVDFNDLNCLSHRDVLILASDGLWNVLSNEKVTEIVTAALNAHSEDDVTKYTLIAEELVAAARGQSTDGITWLLEDESQPASDDDISVFVIPLKFSFIPNADDDVELLT